VSDIIDNDILISLIQERPVLWNKPLDIFKDREATRNACHEVCVGFQSDFDQLEEREREMILLFNEVDKNNYFPVK
jgi:hypothetical protein